MQIVTDPATNRIQGGNYDANENDLSQGSYDVANTSSRAGQALYGYAPGGKRVWKAPDGVAADEEFYFWSPQGQRLGTYKSTNPGTASFTTASTNVYFGGRLIQAQGAKRDARSHRLPGGRKYSGTALPLNTSRGAVVPLRDPQLLRFPTRQNQVSPALTRKTKPSRSTIAGGKTPVPCAALTLLMLGPGARSRMRPSAR
jgi:hypothetical protein